MPDVYKCTGILANGNPATTQDGGKVMSFKTKIKGFEIFISRQKDKVTVKMSDSPEARGYVLKQIPGKQEFRGTAKGGRIVHFTHKVIVGKLIIH